MTHEDTYAHDEPTPADVADMTPVPRAHDAPPPRKIVRFDDIVKSNDIVREWIPIPEWAPEGDPDADSYGIYAKALTGTERARWIEKNNVIAKDGSRKMDPRSGTVILLLAGCVNEDGSRAFTDKEADYLMRKSSAVIERITEAVTRLSGIGDDDVAGNSNGDLDESSNT